MSAELEDEIILSEVFLEILSKEDMPLLKEFLDEQNISDVVELVNEFPEKEGLIIDTMTVHRAVSVFKLLDINQQKDIIKELPARKTAKILNELPPDEFYYIPIQSWIKETKKTGIHGNEALTMKQKFEVLNIKFDPYNEAINSNAQTNPLINSSVNPYKSENILTFSDLYVFIPP